MKNIILSIIVIGRNEESGLVGLRNSLQPLVERAVCETIYVDSASEDNSANLARALFDVTILLGEDENLSASAGRSIGVQNSAGKWLLFLDGDMLLEAAIVDDILIHISRGIETDGLVGTYVHEYDDRSVREQKYHSDRNGFADHFGGAVLLPASALHSENWDPRLFSNEEIDLYTRLRQRGVRVKLVDRPFIRHHTERFSKAQILKGIFIRKNSYLGKKFFGVGQMLLARITDGKFFSLIRWLPEPFVLWLGILISLICLTIDGESIGLLIFALSIVFVCFRKSPRYVIIYAAFFPQAIYGFLNFSPNWRPTVISIFRQQSLRGEKE